MSNLTGVSVAIDGEQLVKVKKKVNGLVTVKRGDLCLDRHHHNELV